MSQPLQSRSKKTPRINSDITSSELRLIDETGKMIGLVATSQALELAQRVSLDLVEIAPEANPPVAKIMNYGKFLYTQSKQQRLHKAKQKKIELKSLRISFKIESHDLEVKLRQAYKFLEQGHKVKFDMILRGREKAFFEPARQKMQAILATLPDTVKFDQELKRSPQGFSVVLAKKI